MGLDLTRQNVLCTVNPVGGGGRAAEIGKSYVGHFANKGCLVVPLDPNNPTRTARGADVRTHLSANPHGNLFVLPTVADQRQRLASLEMGLRSIHYDRALDNQAQAPVLLVAGGDNTGAESEEVAASVVGLDLQTRFEDRFGREGSRERLTKAPRIAIPVPAGTACDLTRHLGAMEEKGNVVDYLEAACDIFLPSSVTLFKSTEGNFLRGTLHTFGFGSLAYLFARAEETKHSPFFKGKTANYVKEAPALAASKIIAAMFRSPEMREALRMARENPVDPFYCRYSINGNDISMIRTGDIIGTGLLFIATGIHNPNPRNDGVVIYFMPAMTAHLMIAATESAVRGAWMMLRQNEERAWAAGRTLASLSDEQRHIFSPGDFIDMEYFQNDLATERAFPFGQINGTPVNKKGSPGTIHGATTRITDPSIFLGSPQSLGYRWGDTPHNQ